MRTIYPKLITTLFIALLVAILARYAGAAVETTAHQSGSRSGYTSYR